MSLKVFATSFAAIFLMGCVSQKAPVSSLEIPPLSQINTHIVQQGETLYSIAWRYDLDVEYLARVNKIGTQFRIKTGQAIQISSELEKQKELRGQKPRVVMERKRYPTGIKLDLSKIQIQ